MFAMEEREIRILAIESSCDETAAAVVCNGRDVRSNIISTQIPLHTLYGGVVPEIASRKHMERINQVITAALSEADTTLDDLDAVAVTYGPGLVGALLVGVAEAKAIAFARKLPLIGVHHIEGHISANYIENKDLKPPFLCLVVSGGHTHLVNVEDYGVYRILGRTRDDAAGEAFDKVARAIGLGYPGGPKIEQKAKEGDPNAIPFPIARIEDAPYDFSFSGSEVGGPQLYQRQKDERRELQRGGHCRLLPEGGHRSPGGPCHAGSGRVRREYFCHRRRCGFQRHAASGYGGGLPGKRGKILPSFAHSLHGQRSHDRRRGLL